MESFAVRDNNRESEEKRVGRKSIFMGDEGDDVNAQTNKSSFPFYTAGSPAYDSVRSLAYHDANVFLLCYKISDPISLYNVKNKWVGEIRRHHPRAPVVLCGCQEDLREDPLTVAHLSKTGRAPVSHEQALAICCEVGAVHYVETSARRPATKELKDSVLEAFELCASAAIKHMSNNNGNNNVGGFRRSPSIHSSVSLALFDSDKKAASPTDNHPPSAAPIPPNLNGNFKRSPSTHSTLSLTSNFRMPVLPAFKRSSTASVASLRSPSAASANILLAASLEQDARPTAMRTFSPEPMSTSSSSSSSSSSYSSAACRIPPVISEHEQLQSPVSSSDFSGSFCSPATAANAANAKRHHRFRHTRAKMNGNQVLTNRNSA